MDSGLHPNCAKHPQEGMQASLGKVEYSIVQKKKNRLLMEPLFYLGFTFLTLIQSIPLPLIQDTH